MSADRQTPYVPSASAPGWTDPPPAPPAPPAAAAATAWAPPGGLARRLTARLIDAGMYLLLLGLIFVVAPPDPGPAGPGALYQGLILGLIATLLLYEFVMVKLVGWTVGKRILGLRVVSTEGGTVGWGAAAGRSYVPLLANACTLGIGGLLFELSPLFDDSPWQRGWPDKIASTVVIRTRGPAPAGPMPVVLLGGVAAAPVVDPGILRSRAVLDALEAYGRRVMAGEAPWTAATMPLAALRDRIPAVQGRAEAGHILDDLLLAARLSPWHGVGAWRFAAEHGLAPWRKTALPTFFLDALKQIMADPASPAIAYRLDSFEAQLVRDREPAESSLRRLLPAQPM